MNGHEMQMQKQVASVQQELQPSKKGDLAVKRKAERRSLYPKILVEFTRNFTVFYTAVRKSAEQIDFDDVTKFTDEERRFYQTMRASGADAAYAELQATIRQLRETRPERVSRVKSRTLTNLGLQIMKTVPVDIVAEALPMKPFLIEYRGTEIVVKIST